MSNAKGGLAAHVGRLVELRYEDGAIVRGKLVAIDPDDLEELTYELREVVCAAPSIAANTPVGTRVVAELHELIDDWRLIE
jgi:hypothetical protein